MADKKITALNQLSSAIGSDVFPIVSISEGETKKISLADLMGSPGPIGTNTPSSARFSSLRLLSGASVTKFSVDGTLVSNSNDFVPTEQAVKTYVDTQIAGFVNHNSTLGLQGGNSSDEFYHLNENTYIGLYSSTNLIGLGNSSGTSFSVDYGSNSIIARISSNSYLTINNSGVKLQSGAFVTRFSIDGTLSNNSDSIIPTEKAVKTYVDTEITTLQNRLDIINVRFVSSDTTAVAGDILLVDTTSNSVNIQLLEVNDGRITVKKITTDANSVVISTTPGVIDGQASITIDTPYQAYVFVSDGDDFFIV